MLKMCSTPLTNIGKPRVQRFDSDTILITDNEVLIRCAMKYYYVFKVPTMVMESQKRERKYTSADKASLDIYCNSDRIGVTVNLSQQINTIMWDRVNRNGDWKNAIKAYYDNCLLSILSTIEIDSTKREYPLDCMEELQIVRERYDERDKDGRAIKPKFFAHVARKKGYYNAKNKNYKRQLAPMDFVQEIVDLKKRKPGDKFLSKKDTINSIGDILKNFEGIEAPRFGYVDLVLSMVRTMDNKIRMLYQANENVLSSSEKRRLTSAYYDHCVEAIRTMNLNNATMKELLVAVDQPENFRIKRKLWSILFGALGREFSTLLAESKKPISVIQECAAGENGDTRIFWLKFKHVVA